MYALASSGVVWAPAQISWQVVLAEGSDVRPGVGSAPAQISWQAQHFAACQGVGCTPWRRLASAGHRRRFHGRRSTLLLAIKGSDVRPGVVWRQLGTGAHLVAGTALCCLPRGRMYALASSGHRRSLRGRHSTLLLAKGSDVRPGVVWRRLGTGADFVAGAVLAKGSDVRPGVVWRRLGTGADFVAGAVLCCLPRGRMYALASSGVGWALAPHCCVGFLFFLLRLLARPPPSSSLLPPSSSLTTTSLTQHLSQQHLSQQQRHSDNIPHTTHNITHTTSLTTTSHAQQHTHNITHTTSDAKGSDDNITQRTSHTQRLTHHSTHTTSLTKTSHTQQHTHNISHTTSDAKVQFAWQAQHFAACQGVGCTPWRRLASAGHRRRFRGRRSTLLLAKGSDVRPGVGWAPAQISWQAQHFAAGQEVGCTPWRRLASAGHRRAGAALCCLPRGRMYALASSGVVWRRLGTGAVCVAGAVLCYAPRGRMYALASSGVGWAPAQISWQAQHFAAGQGVGCTPWRRLASAGHRRRFRGRGSTLQHFAVCQGVGCTPCRRRLASAGHRRRFRGRCSTLLLAKGSDVRPSVVWRRVASAGHRRSLRGRRSTLLHAKGSDVRPGVVWRRLGTGADFVAGAALCCWPRGRMYALASSGVGWAPAQISWQAQHLWSWKLRTGDFVVQL